MELLFQGPTTVSSFVFTLALLIWAYFFSKAHKTVSRNVHLCVSCLVLIMASFVWVHFYFYSLDTLTPIYESVIENIKLIIRNDALALYFGEFSGPNMQAAEIKFWLYDIRDITIVAFVWIVFESIRRGFSWWRRLLWLNLCFLASLAGGIAFFLTVFETGPKQDHRGNQDSKENTPLLFALILCSLLLVCIYITFVEISDAALSIQFTLMFLLALVPASFYKNSNSSVSLSVLTKQVQAFTIYAILFAYCSLIRINDVYQIILAKPITTEVNTFSYLTSTIYDAGINNLVVFGTVSGEVFNIILLTSIFLAFFIQKKKGVKAVNIYGLFLPLTAACTFGFGAGAALYLLLREKQRNVQYK